MSQRDLAAIGKHNKVILPPTMRTNVKQCKAKQRAKDDQEQELMLSPTDLASHEDVLTEILLRLPIRSLLRSKCVSKHWRSLISDHRFALSRNPNPNPPRGLFLQRIGNATPSEYDFVPFDREKNIKPPFKTLNFNGKVSDSRIILLHSSNGLMLCHSLHKHFCTDSIDIVYNNIYYVYNPTINQVATLPKLEGYDLIQKRPRGLTLVFDPSKSPNYKVICVHKNIQSNHLRNIHIYSSENQNWKTLGEPIANQTDTKFTGGVYWNNAVHWINTLGFIFYLKINEEQIDQIRTPIFRESWEFKRHCYPLVESRDCLLFMDIFPSLSTDFDIYEMNRDYSGWSIKYNIDLSQEIAKFSEPAFCMLDYLPVIRFAIHCLILGENEDEDESFLVIEVPGRAVRYNIMLKSCEVLCELDFFKPSRLSVEDDDEISKFGRWPGAFLFFESLCNV